MYFIVYCIVIYCTVLYIWFAYVMFSAFVLDWFALIRLGFSLVSFIFFSIWFVVFIILNCIMYCDVL